MMSAPSDLPKTDKLHVICGIFFAGLKLFAVANVLDDTVEFAEVHPGRATLR